MATSQFIVRVDSRAVDSALQNLQQRLGNLQPVLRSIGAEMESRVSARFETRSDPNGQRWQVWAQSTVDTYPKDGRRKLLERSGAMLGSLASRVGSGSVRIGFGQDYATFHEFGAPKNNLPRRALLFGDPQAGTLGAADEAALLELLGDWIDGAIA